MPYTVARQRGAEETTAQELEAASAVRLVRHWSVAYPQQYLVIRDDKGAPVAYRQPSPAAYFPGVQQALYS